MKSLLFSLANRAFALPVESVAEVARPTELAAVPGPSWVAGVLRQRNSAIWVVHLCPSQAEPARSGTRRSCGHPPAGGRSAPRSARAAGAGRRTADAASRPVRPRGPGGGTGRASFKGSCPTLVGRCMCLLLIDFLTPANCATSASHRPSGAFLHEVHLVSLKLFLMLGARRSSGVVRLSHAGRRQRPACRTERNTADWRPCNIWGRCVTGSSCSSNTACLAGLAVRREKRPRQRGRAWPWPSTVSTPRRPR